MVLAAASVCLADSSIPPDASHKIAVFTQPPTGIPTQSMPGGPLLGNGDVGIVMAGPAEEQQYYIGKNDFWRRTGASVETVGHLTLSIPSLKGGTYRLEEDMTLAETQGIFTQGWNSGPHSFLGGRKGEPAAD